jgi:hypothetical protein
MHLRFSLSSVSAITAALALAPAAALAEEVTITGCPQPGIEAGCIVISGTGGIYNITSAKPTPTIGVAGKVTGTVSGGVSSCGQGNILSPATWTPVDGVECTDPSRA